MKLEPAAMREAHRHPHPASPIEGEEKIGTGAPLPLDGGGLEWG
jgi:hypothetical protein